MSVAANAFSGNIAIPDNDFIGILNALAIGGVTGAAVISKITVTLSISHPVDEDVDIFLFDPDGNFIVLSTDNGVGGGNYTNTTFDDAATASITSGSPPFTGSFRPEQALSGLYPGAINGSWSLKVADDLAADTGSLLAWSIAITYANATPVVALEPVIAALPEGTPTAARIKVANIVVADDGVGNNVRSLTGPDAAFFEIVGNELFLKAGTQLDFETKSSLKVAVAVNDPAIPGNPNATSAVYTLNVGNLSPETINGTAAGETLTGNSDVNLIFGFAGNDALGGREGNDFLSGGGGKDKYLFNTALDPVGNVDKITDFKPGKDRIGLDHFVFDSLGKAGKLKGKFFTVGKRADDKNDYVIYNAKTGKLFSDADGKGGAGQVQFATLSKKLDLDHTDFFVI